MLSRILIAVSAVAVLCAQEAAPFNGSWVMNKAKSDFGAMPEQMIPEKLSMKITATEGELRTVSTQVGARGESMSEAVYKLDGKTESVNKTFGGEAKSVGKWDGGTVEIVTSREVQGMALTITQRMTKSAADVLMIETKVAGSPLGDLVMKYHMDRASGEAVVAKAGPAAVKAPGTAASAADFNGSWKLNRAKSDFGALPEEFQPAAMTREIQHDAAGARVKSAQTGAQGELKFDIQLKFDGTETVNNMGDGEARSVAKWEGDAVSIVSRRDYQGTALTIRERWTRLEANTMQVDTTVAGTPIGDIVMKYLFEKQ
jgi:hypothetical protein